MRKVYLFVFLVLMAFSIDAAETTYACRHYQSDIDMWQDAYAKEVKKSQGLLKELMDLKMKVLERGIKIPDALYKAEIITGEIVHEPLPSYY